jgi:hypothetical protein
MGPKLIVRRSVLLLLLYAVMVWTTTTFCAKHIKVLFRHTAEFFDVKSWTALKSRNQYVSNDTG